MNQRHVIVLAAAFLALLGFAGYATSIVLQQREQLDALRNRSAQLATESATLRREREADVKELAEAERQLSELPPPKAGALTVSLEQRTEIKAWLARVKRLRQLFEERPDQRIPEMQFLTDQDWLRVAKSNELNSEDGRRKALAAARDAAISHFTSQLSMALWNFAKTASTDASPTIFTLGPFLEKPADAALLERYELRKAPPSGLRGSIEWSVQNKAPIDPDYDSQFYVRASDSGNSGMGNMSAPLAWIPDFRERAARAVKDFTASGKPPPTGGLTDLLPYFNPPLDPATVARIIKAERDGQK